MNKHTLRALGLLASMTALTVAIAPPQNLTTQVSTNACIGKPYGSPGCPVKSGSSSEPKQNAVAENCGDMILDPDEECDEGRFNGSSYCSKSCAVLYCGDGSVDDAIGEECEPEMQEVYVFDQETRQLTTELRFAEQTCGTVCTVPVCDNEGNCNADRCTWKFLPPCAGSSAAAGSVGFSDAQKLSMNVSPGGGQAQALADPEQQPETAHQAAPTFSAPSSQCGNGILEGGEQCDDGNGNAFDTCPNDCTVSACGDGQIEGWEECDDSNRNNFDECPNDCSNAICGDGVREGTEQCDDGNFNNRDDCPNTCKIPYCGNKIREGREECDDGNLSDYDECPNDCQNPVCGDGVREGSEDCDDGNRVDADSCTNSCRISACGDSSVQSGEQCDDGNRENLDACPNDCLFPICGDGIREGPEECDDGNGDNYDECPNDCSIPVCGDGMREGVEECEDGNARDNDDCSNTCMLAVCGNGDREGREECDDGNTNFGDGCAPDCASETVCGNGIVEGVEQCDAGAGNSDEVSNTCRTTCENTYCGDGVVDDGEQCDGGKTCSAQCLNLSLVERSPGTFVGGTVVAAAAIVGSLVLFYRKRLLTLSYRAAEAVSELSLDDIPLDELEMPWHKWNKQ